MRSRQLLYFYYYYYWCYLFSDLNLLDWSVNNHLAVCLGPSVYLWNASNGEINQLLQLENPEEYVGAVSWIKEGNYLAVGTSTGEVQVCIKTLTFLCLLKKERSIKFQLLSFCPSKYFLFPFSPAFQTILFSMITYHN